MESFWLIVHHFIPLYIFHNYSMLLDNLMIYDQVIQLLILDGMELNGWVDEWMDGCMDG